MNLNYKLELQIGVVFISAEKNIALVKLKVNTTQYHEYMVYIVVITYIGYVYNVNKNLEFIQVQNHNETNIIF